MHEAELDSGEFANARFYFDYGATAEQAASSGDPEAAMRLMFQALAWNPYEPEVALRFYARASVDYFGIAMERLADASNRSWPWW